MAAPLVGGALVTLLPPIVAEVEQLFKTYLAADDGASVVVSVGCGRPTKMWLWPAVALLVAVLSGSCARPPAAQRAAPPPGQPSTRVDEAIDRQRWREMQDFPARWVDKCAVPLAHERALDTRRDWPAYCNRFRDTDLVTARVSQLRSIFQALALSPDQRE